MWMCQVLGQVAGSSPAPPLSLTNSVVVFQEPLDDVPPLLVPTDPQVLGLCSHIFTGWIGIFPFEKMLFQVFRRVYANQCFPEFRCQTASADPSLYCRYPFIERRSDMRTHTLQISVEGALYSASRAANQNNGVALIWHVACAIPGLHMVMPPHSNQGVNGVARGLLCEVVRPYSATDIPNIHFASFPSLVLARAMATTQ